MKARKFPRRPKRNSSYFPGERELIERIRKKVEARGGTHESRVEMTHRWHLAGLRLPCEEAARKLKYHVDRSPLLPGEREMVLRVRKKIEARAKERDLRKADTRR